MSEINLVRWWEEELTSEERNELMGDYMWHGSIEERRQKLSEMYQTYKSINSDTDESKEVRKDG